jgi:hypothetical protein
MGGRRKIPASFRFAMQLVSLQAASEIRVTDPRVNQCHVPVSSHKDEVGSYFLPILPDTESRQLMTDGWQNWCSRQYISGLFLKPPIYISYIPCNVWNSGNSVREISMLVLTVEVTQTSPSYKCGDYG